MLTVTGTLDGVGYRVGIHPEGLDHPDAVGVTMGSSAVLNLISLHEGREVQASPTSDPVTVDPANASTVLALLYAETTVASLDGDTDPVRDVLPLDAPGTLY